MVEEEADVMMTDVVGVEAAMTIVAVIVATPGSTEGAAGLTPGTEARREAAASPGGEEEGGATASPGAGASRTAEFYSKSKDFSRQRL